MVAPKVAQLTENECLAVKFQNDGDQSSDSESEYEILHPEYDATQEILSDSEFFRKFMLSAFESVLRFCCSFPRRVRHLLVALEVGTFVSAVMSACDEIVLKFVRGVARVVHNQPGGEELLEWLTFGVPKNGKAPTDDWEIKLIKNLVFINLCAVEHSMTLVRREKGGEQAGIERLSLDQHVLAKIFVFFYPPVLRQVPESNHDAESRITFGDDLLDAAGGKPIMNQRTPSCEAYPSGRCEL
ncbi:F-box protein [Phytophthora cinnamomi]|uniref:F-box protein n=1 Tax=Phytophthora cinnamomi TaxID=4785 RepID=UPI003559E7D2|nr:F-box protein [Phytophthora cinnamomi]